MTAVAYLQLFRRTNRPTHRFRPRRARLALWLKRLKRLKLLMLLCGPAVAFAQIPSDQLPSLAPMIARVSPTVVNISVSSTVPQSGIDDPAIPDLYEGTPDTREFHASGSGVIVDAANGYILTNQHVIANADHITVTLLDNRSMPATIIGSDEGTDLAVLQIHASGLTAVQLGDSDQLRVGDFVVAIGNPFGFSHTVTSGIVSGLGRTGIDPDAYEDFIQTDASINPGNSGGALVDLKGRLVGINSAIISRNGGSVGIGFAIPVNMAREIMHQLTRYGKVSRGRLGVSIRTVTPAIANTYDLSSAAGALVMQVIPSSAAAKAGLAINDIIVAINHHDMPDSGSLKAAIGLKRPGTHVTVGYIRNGHRRSTEAVLGKAANQNMATEEPSPPPHPQDSAVLDKSLEGARLVPQASGPDATVINGLYVASIRTGSPAARGGLRTGDVITRINRHRVDSLEEAGSVLSGAQTVILEVQRSDQGLLLFMR